MKKTETLNVSLGARSYDITVGRGLLSSADSFMRLGRKIMIITDSGVPAEYAEAVAKAAGTARIHTFPEGEASKCLATLESILADMLDFGMTRRDALVAVGGGVVGDITGFAASIFMRGIDFYNIPTTVLSMLDSSIGGKTAIDFRGVKNIVGAFHQPRAVLIDPEVLRTLPKRQIAAGLAEAVKMSVTSNAELFSRFEDGGITLDNIEEVIIPSLKIKKAVVETDERETGLRKILNFGHTYGHGIEALLEGELLHGECVALGMIPMCSPSVRERLIPVLEGLGLPTSHEHDIDAALKFAAHDKKSIGNEIEVIYADMIGGCEIRRMSISELGDHIRSAQA